MQHQPLSSSECFLYVENSPPLLHHNRLSLERLRPLCTFLRLFLISEKSEDGRTSEDKISADDRNFVFPFFQVLIFSDA